MRNLLLLVIFSAVSFSAAVFAADETGMLSIDEARAKLLEAQPALPLIDVRKSSLEGYFEVEVQDRSGPVVVYMDAQANYFFAGDLIFIRPSGLVNATELERNDKRKKLLDTLNEEEMVVFAPDESEIKTTITVFTDIDCGYCRKLHDEVPELNRLGIAVRYMAYPRAGVGSASYDKIVSAWCAENPQVSLTLAKAGQEIKSRTCDNPVADHLALVGEFGLTGTPAIIYEDGTLQPGYLPAAALAQRLGIN